MQQYRKCQNGDKCNNDNYYEVGPMPLDWSFFSMAFGRPLIGELTHETFLIGQKGEAEAGESINAIFVSSWRKHVGFESQNVFVSTFSFASKTGHVETFGRSIHHPTCSAMFAPLRVAIRHWTVHTFNS